MVAFLEDAIRDFDAEAPDAQACEPAAGECAGGSAAGPRQSQRILAAAKKGCDSTVAEDLCEVRRQTGLLVEAPGLPQQGCFCVKGCAGHAGACTNQVPRIETRHNVKVSEGTPGCGRCLKAVRDIKAGEIITVFAGVIIKCVEHAEAYEHFRQVHKVQQQTAAGEKKFEYSAQTGSKEMRGSQAWVVPPQDVLLLKECIEKWELQGSELDVLVEQKTRREGQGLGQFSQHTCCEVHVNSYFFPISVMRKAPRAARGKKRGLDDDEEEEIMDVQALGIRAQKDIKEDEEVLVHYVGAGQAGRGDYVFKCLCCKCAGPCRREGV